MLVVNMGSKQLCPPLMHMKIKVIFEAKTKNNVCEATRAVVFHLCQSFLHSSFLTEDGNPTRFFLIQFTLILPLERVAHLGLRVSPSVPSECAFFVAECVMSWNDVEIAFIITSFRFHKRNLASQISSCRKTLRFVHTFSLKSVRKHWKTRHVHNKKPEETCFRNK